MTTRLGHVLIVVPHLGLGGSQKVVSLLANQWVADGRPVSLVKLWSEHEDFFDLDPNIRSSTLQTGWIGHQAKLVTHVEEEEDTRQSIHAREPSGLSILAEGVLRLNRIPILRDLLNAAHLLRHAGRLRRQIKRADCQVVLSFLPSANVLTLIATLWLGKRVIVCERNDPDRQRVGWKISFLRRLLYRHASAVTANSRHALDALRRYVPNPKLNYVPNPLVLPERIPRVDEREPLVLAVGRLVPQKRYDWLIRAFALCCRGRPSWRLTIVGDGPERSWLRELAAERGLIDRVELRGKLGDVTPLYRAATCLVVTSEYEGTPNSALEAMSYGVPVIVPSSCPGAAEVVRDGVSGLALSDSQDQTLADAIGRLMEDEVLRDRLTRGARECAMPFEIRNAIATWNRVVELPSDPR